MIPRSTTLFHWAHSLIIDFPRDNVPILKNENDWKNWGNILVQENSFSRSGAPGTQRYGDWRSWAEDVFHSMVNFGA
jgi:hypothetical protein